MNIIGRISNRVIVGPPLCRNEEYINANIDFAVEVMIMVHVLAVVSAPFRFFVNRIISPIHGRVEQITNFIQPVVDARGAEEARSGEDYEKPHPTVRFLGMNNGFSDQARGVRQANCPPDDVDELWLHPYDLTREFLLSLPSVSYGDRVCKIQTFTNALLTLLAHPQYIDPLRIEIEQVIKEEGWTKAAMDKIELLESFMKESQRVDIIGAVLGNRLAVGDLTLNGVFIPKGTITSSTPTSPNLRGAPTRSSLTLTAASSFRKNLESRSGLP